MFLQKLLNTPKLQRDLWELSDSHSSHSAKYQLPMAASHSSHGALAGDVARDIPAGNHVQCGELLHCRNQTLICAEPKSAQHYENVAHLLALE